MKDKIQMNQLCILGGSFGEDLNKIEATWQVKPDVYGDNNTKLFTYCTTDAYQAMGCLTYSAQASFKSTVK
ncbi:hypothetical protein L1049_009070 [Liquidambar formosana]|uniref:Neprosin PEP catalytic domain-containing protein n=1 Tax=Liquidambar formosana TaxID=63359 RepID=A0AAP0X4Z5_LIQFO